jgi:hypothetical protein
MTTAQVQTMKLKVDRALKRKRLLFLIILAPIFYFFYNFGVETPALSRCDESGLQNCSEPTFFGFEIGRRKVAESLCGEKSSRRGFGQKVVSFSLFGNVRSSGGELSWYGKVRLNPRNTNCREKRAFGRLQYTSSLR